MHNKFLLTLNYMQNNGIFFQNQIKSKEEKLQVFISHMN